MSLRLHDFFVRHTVRGSPTMIVEGEDIVAHVHNPDYLPLFLHAPEMRSLIEKLSARNCDPSNPHHDADSCEACQARILLSKIRKERSLSPRIDSKISVLG